MLPENCCGQTTTGFPTRTLASGSDFVAKRLSEERGKEAGGNDSGAIGEIGDGSRGTSLRARRGHSAAGSRGAGRQRWSWGSGRAGRRGRGRGVVTARHEVVRVEGAALVLDVGLAGSLAFRVTRVGGNAVLVGTLADELRKGGDGLARGHDAVERQETVEELTLSMVWV